ncbi:MAG TPA: hypothetical protein PKO45_14060 [Rubrivivax sp.]|nr:hypothetical protein [Burkholderiales bacterium]HNT40236.1 hypothetical protein [Rubrivivax sp.]
MNAFDRRRALKARVAAASLAPAPGLVRGQGRHPSKPVTLLVPQPPGRAADASCRSLQVRMQALLGRPESVQRGKPIKQVGIKPD